MKIFHSAILALAIGAASLTSAQAHDSFSFGLNIGGGYPPPVYYAPPVTYYNPPVVYYRAEPRYYGSEPIVSYQYYDGHNSGWGHEDEHHGWGHGHHGGGHGGHGHGHHDDDDD